MRNGARGGRRGHRSALPLALLAAFGLVAAVSPSPAPDPVASPGDRVITAPEPTPETAPDPTPTPTPEPPAPPVDPATLPRPALEAILPSGLPTARGATGLAAVPRDALVVGYTAPSGTPAIALEAAGLGIQARWAVTDTSAGWVQVLVPFGRGALPSVDPERTNHVAAWVRAADVEVTPAAVLTLSLAARTLTVGDRTFPVAVGRDATPTPTGLCAVVGQVFDPHVGDALLTSCQSQAMDEFYAGTGYAVIALHADPEGGAAIGHARSNGCVRMRAGDFTELLAAVPAGSVVQIVD